MSEVTDEIKEKAKVIAEATGRSEQAIIDDLMDDGIVNLSNEEKKDATLVEQLKEAAELIATVQSINQQVSDNTVLNGGNNKTEVAVETTLEGDIIDRAIESVQRKADNIKKIAVTLVPVFLLLTGGSMEAVGITNFFGSDDSDDDYDPDYYVEYGGCLNPDALNYDPEADYDDGSCEFENSGGGGGPPDCYEDWRWDAVTIQDFDANGEGFNNDLQIQMTFNDWNKCNRHMEGYFVVEIWDEDRGFMWDSYQIDNKFHDQYTIDDHHYDMDTGGYAVSVEYHFDGSYWEGPSAYVFIEAPDPEPVYGCTDSEATNYDDKATEDDGSCEYPSNLDDCSVSVENHYRGHENNDPDSTTMIVSFDIVPTDCEDFSIDWSIQLYQEGYTANYTRTGSTFGQDYITETFENMPAGTWIPKIRIVVDGDEKWEANFWNLEIVDPEPDNCEINLYDIAFGTNDTHATVAYDLDCGYGQETGGYNVSVQFMVIGNESYEMGYQFNTTLHYISGYVEDIHVLTLSNFTHENITHYDFAWFAIWGDENNPNYIERYWNNIAFDHPTEDPEPQPCENLTITSESLTLYAYGDDLGIAWNLTHDGPRTSDCYVEVEIFITLYQNGSYYNVSEYHQNPTFMVFNNHDGNQTMVFGPDEIALFKDLPDGEYEILAKYRNKDTNEASGDHFANMVTISTS